MKKTLFLFFIFAQILTASSYDGWEYWYGGKFLRFSIPFKSPVDYNIVRMEDKRLFVVDIAHDFKEETIYSVIDRGNVESLRIGAFRPGIMRVVVKLKYVNEVKVYKAVKKIKDRYYLFIDVDDYYIAQENEEKEVLNVTLDPGHGGFDPGALNHKFNIMEKDLCLDVASKVRWIFETGGYDDIKISLTRDEDIFLPLVKRARLSTRLGTDLFISIHADASYRKSANGASVYYYSKNSSTLEANWLVAQESSSIVEQKDEKNAGLSHIIGDLVNSKNLKMSSLFAGMQKLALRREGIDIHGSGVFGADFTVLQYNSSPAVLFEMGFISSDEECKKLMSNLHRYNLAKALASAIIDYYKYTRDGEVPTGSMPDVISASEKDKMPERALNRYCVDNDYLKVKNKRGNM
ncbi:MAG: N-acetylmuramoyl-L-alanine amidase [Candidatus Muiribacteriaceae bacterium]